MYSKGKGSTVPSDNQAREKLALYVYEYLIHTGAQKAAQIFLEEIRWDKAITLAEPPGFLTSWWSVFWDLYSAAPERRETFEHSNEAKAFHDYGFVGSGFPNGMGPNPGGPGPMQIPPQDGCMPPSSGPGGMGPGFYGPHGPMMELRPGMQPMLLVPHQRGPMPPHGHPHHPTRLPPSHMGGPLMSPYRPPHLMSLGMPPGPQMPPSQPPRGTTPGGMPPCSAPGPPLWMPGSSSGGSYSSASPVPFNGPPSTGSGTPGVPPSPHHQQDSLYDLVARGNGGPPGMYPPCSQGGHMSMHEGNEMGMMNGGPLQSLEMMKHSPGLMGCGDDPSRGGMMAGQGDFGGPMFNETGMMVQQNNHSNNTYSDFGDLHFHEEFGDGDFKLCRIWKDQSDNAAIQKLKESMQEDAKMYELVDNDYFLQQ